VRLGWATDLHLDRAPAARRDRFLHTVAERHRSGAIEALVVTGDLAEGDASVWAAHVTRLFDASPGLPLYFVLGNHDFYRARSIADRRDQAGRMRNAVYLRGRATWLRPDVALVGVDGWGDARYGELTAWALPNDALNIPDLIRAFLQKRTAGALRRQGSVEGLSLRRSLADALRGNPSKVIVATHVPPFPEVSVFKGVAGDPHGVPYFACKATGDVLLEVAGKNPAVEFLVLAGHTHGKAAKQIRSNLRVLVGAAAYESPGLQATIDIT